MNIIYLRVSTNEDRQDLEQQKKAIIEKYELKDFKVLMDEGSAYDQSKINKRTDFLELLNICFDADKVTVKDLFVNEYATKEINLFVWDYSRIMRNIENNLLFYLLLLKHKVNIHSWKDNAMIELKEGIEPTPSQRLMSILNYLLLSYSAEMYSKDTSTNITRASDGEGYSVYGIKWGTYIANDNWKEFWSAKLVNNKGKEMDRITSNNRLRVTKEEDIKFKAYIKRQLQSNMRKDVIDIVKERKGIILTHKFISTNFR